MQAFEHLEQQDHGAAGKPITCLPWPALSSTA